MTRPTSPVGAALVGAYVVLALVAGLLFGLRVRADPQVGDLLPLYVGAVSLPWSLLWLIAPGSTLLLALVAAFGIPLNFFGLYRFGQWVDRRADAA